MNKFTEPVRQALHAAHDFAGEFVGTEHLLLALATVPGVASRVLGDEGLSAERLSTVLASGPGGSSGSIPFSPGAKRVLELALGEALGRGDADIGTGHVLLALLSDDIDTAAAAVLLDAGAERRTLRRSIDNVLGAGERDVGP